MGHLFQGANPDISTLSEILGYVVPLNSSQKTFDSSKINTPHLQLNINRMLDRRLHSSDTREFPS